jgi:hypothetical protein
MPDLNEEQMQTASKMALWIGVLLPLVIVATEMQTNFVLVRQACAAERKSWLYIVVAVALIITALTGVTSAVAYQRMGGKWPNETADIANRARFISALGMMMSAISFALILAHGIATIKFDPCQP